MRMFIPPVNAIITLLEPWTFRLRRDPINYALLRDFAGLPGRLFNKSHYAIWKSVTDSIVIFEAGTKLKFGTIKTTSGGKSYSIVKMSVYDHRATKWIKGKRAFFCLLSEVNNIEYELYSMRKFDDYV